MKVALRHIVGVSWWGIDPPSLAHVVRFHDGSEEIHAGDLGDDGDGCWIGRTCAPSQRMSHNDDGVS